MSSMSTTTNHDNATTNRQQRLAQQHSIVHAKMIELEKATEMYHHAEQVMRRLTRELCELRNFKPSPQNQQQQQQHDGDEEEAATAAVADRDDAEFGGGYIYRRYLGPEIHHLEHLLDYVMSTNRQQWNTAFQWVRDCIALRCNDNRHTQIKAYHPWINNGHLSSSTTTHSKLCVKHYATILSGCLRWNTHVTDLTVNMSLLLSGEEERWRSRHETTTNEQQILSCMKKSILQPVLKYMATSPILRRVSIVSDSTTQSRDLSAAFLDATRQNPSIVELHVAGRVPPCAFVRLLSSSSITTLSMDCYTISRNANRDERLERVHLCKAFSASHGLEQIRLLSFDSAWSYLLVCLAQQGATSRLQQLTLVAAKKTNDNNTVVRRQDFHTLMQLIQRSTTIKHLTLEEFALNADDVHCILHGIRLRHEQQRQQLHATTDTGSTTENDDDIATTTMTKLSFIRCTFIDDEAARTLIDFFQSSSSNNHNDDDDDDDDDGSCMVVRPLPVVLAELEIQFCTFAEPTEYFPLSGLTLGQAMAALITPKTTSVMPSAQNVNIAAATTTATKHPNHPQTTTTTIGSQLQVLSLCPFSPMTGFCQTILPHTKTVQLSTLNLSHVVEEDIEELVTCLPYLLSLQKLHLRMEYNDTHPDEILQLIQLCGNLRTVTVLDMHHKPLFNNRQLLLAESFCDRNRILSQIHHTRTRRPDSSDYRKQQQPPPPTKRQKTGHCDIHENVTLMPRLLQTAKQVPYTRVSVIMSALMCFEYDFGIGSILANN